MTIVGHSAPITQKLLALISSGKGFSAAELLQIEFTKQPAVNDSAASTISHEARILC